MPSSCAVPKCNISKRKGEKICTFSVPKNEEMKEKWKQLIGVSVLRSSQRICEKHFDDKYIIKEYIKYDQNGKIISQVPFKRARLEVGAIPTIFEERTLKHRSPQKNWYQLQQNIFLDHAYSLRIKLNKNDICNSNNYDISLTEHLKSETEIILQDTNIQGILNDIPKSVVDVTTRNDCCNTIKLNSVHCEDVLKLNNSKEPKILKKEDLQDQSQLFLKETILPESNIKSCSTDHSVTTNKYIDVCDLKISNVLKDPDINLLSKNKLCQPNTNSLDESSNMNKIFINSFCLRSNAFTFNFEVPCKGFANNFIEIQMPKPWSLSKALIGQEEVLLFTYIVEGENIYQRKGHFFEKTVIIKSSRKILYEVFSTNVNDVVNTILPEILENLHALPEILKKFKDFYICKGIEETLPLILHTTTFQTCTGTDLRHRKCTLLSFKSKRCKACKLFSTSVSKKVIEKKNQKTLLHVPTSTNSFDQMKLKAMRKRTKLRAKQFNRLKQKLSLINESITPQEEKVSSLSDEQLKKSKSKDFLFKKCYY